jgi:hypothetical protein
VSKELAPQWKEVADFVAWCKHTLSAEVPPVPDLGDLLDDLSQKVITAFTAAPPHDYSQESDVTLLGWLVFLRAFKCGVIAACLKPVNPITPVRFAREYLSEQLDNVALVMLFQKHLQTCKGGPVAALFRIVNLLFAWVEEQAVERELEKRLAPHPVGLALLMVLRSTGGGSTRQTGAPPSQVTTLTLPIS